jgi:hypothetical protein
VLVIGSYRDKRTREFAAGKRVKAFSGFERPARLKLDRMEAATLLGDLAALPGNRFEAFARRSQGPIEHPHQRSLADLFRMGGWSAWTFKGGDR